MWATALYSELADARRRKFSFAEFGCDVLRVGRIRDRIKKKEKKKGGGIAVPKPSFVLFFFPRGGLYLRGQILHFGGSLPAENRAPGHAGRELGTLDARLVCTYGLTGLKYRALLSIGQWLEVAQRGYSIGHSRSLKD